MAAVAAEPGLRLVESTVDRYVVSRPKQYDYVPDVIFDAGAFHLYWCGSVAGAPGDHILHAVSAAATGPFHAAADDTAGSFDIVLAPSGVAGRFDGEHTCDPSVIKAGSIYYLYYDGAALGANGHDSAIGVAASADGLHFSRLDGGAAIVVPARTSATPATPYGAGQPAVFRKGELFFLSFTDTMGGGANPANGAGQFLLRSPDPTFRTDVEELIGAGWRPRAAGRHTAEFAYLPTFSVDIAYDAPTNTLLVASDQIPSETWIYLLDAETYAVLGRAGLPGTWRDGPSMAKNADRTTLPRPTCDRLALSVFKGAGPEASRNDVTTWDIAVAQGTFRLAPELCSKP